MVEKNRTAAISQTVLSLSHAINDPLMIISGNMEVIRKKINNSSTPEEKEALEIIDENHRRISEVLQKMSRITKPVIGPISVSEACNIDALDLDKSL